MKHLIEIIEDEARVSHRVVAQETSNQIISIQNLITKNIKDFEEFGTLHFKNEGSVNNGKGEQPKTYYLNEQQATFLMTLLRNKPIVIKFKKALVKAFYKLKEEKTPSIETNQNPDTLSVVMKIVENQQRFIENQQMFMHLQMDKSDRLQDMIEEVLINQPLYKGVIEPMDSTTRRNIRNALDDKAKELSKKRGVLKTTIAPSMWIEMKRYFKVDDYQDIPSSEYHNVMQWIEVYDIIDTPIPKPYI